MDFVVGPLDYEMIKIIGPEKYYRIARRHSENFAERHNRILAEGPTLRIQQEFNTVELWPLVQEVDSAISG
jgi:hypothetical protein